MLTKTSSIILVEAGAADRPKAAVIGSGFGGLAAAIRLGARGDQVTFLKKLDAPGGRAFGFEPKVFPSVWCRSENRNEDVCNLNLVSAGTQPGAGLPGVLSSARVPDKVVPHATEFS